jgi:hypothetical protein
MKLILNSGIEIYCPAKVAFRSQYINNYFDKVIPEDSSIDLPMEIKDPKIVQYVINYLVGASTLPNPLILDALVTNVDLTTKGIPEWAVKFITDLNHYELFEVLYYADLLGIKRLVNLAAVQAANIYLGMSDTVKNEIFKLQREPTRDEINIAKNIPVKLDEELFIEY